MFHRVCLAVRMAWAAYTQHRWLMVADAAIIAFAIGSFLLGCSSY